MGFPLYLFLICNKNACLYARNESDCKSTVFPLAYLQNFMLFFLGFGVPFIVKCKSIFLIKSSPFLKKAPAIFLSSLRIAIYKVQKRSFKNEKIQNNKINYSWRFKPIHGLEENPGEVFSSNTSR